MRETLMTTFHAASTLRGAATTLRCAVRTFYRGWMTWRIESMAASREGMDLCGGRRALRGDAATAIGAALVAGQTSGTIRTRPREVASRVAQCHLPNDYANVHLFRSTVPWMLAMVASSFGMSGAAQAQPVQYAGNCNWYQVVVVNDNISWTAARSAATLAGGHLVTLTNRDEDSFVRALTISTPGALFVLRPGQPTARILGPWLGGYQLPGSSEPGGGWTWVTGEPWAYTNWANVQPDNSGPENYLHYYSTIETSFEGSWNDRADNDGGRNTGFIVEWDNPNQFAPSLVIGVQPTSAPVCPSGVAIFSATVVPALSGPFSYQWRKGGIPLDTLANPSAATATLTLTNIQAADVGSYDCIVSNACGSVTSNAATLSVCPANINCDESVNFGDFLAFFNCYDTETPCADIDGNPGVDFGDFLAFFNAYDAGC
jgi:hypothetical protein